MGLIVGSARHDENGKLTGGKAGDQLQSNQIDLSGECSMQNFYVHSKGWYILRPVTKKLADQIALGMATACNNSNIGYSQNCQRKTVDNITTLVKINVDCSKLVRDVIWFASKSDVGNFTTANEASVLEKSGLFNKRITFVSLAKTPIYDGDVLVTKTKGHTVVAITGNERPKDVTYYPKYNGTSTSLIVALGVVGEKNTSLAHRKEIAKANNVTGYTGTASQNTLLLKLLKAGKLVKV